MKTKLTTTGTSTHHADQHSSRFLAQPAQARPATRTTGHVQLTGRRDSRQPNLARASITAHPTGPNNGAVFRHPPLKLSPLHAAAVPRRHRLRHALQNTPHYPRTHQQIHPGASRSTGTLAVKGVVGQGKCPGKCSAKMSLRYAAMVSDVDGLGTIRCFHPGGLPASR